jgi:hypothetical protein
VSTPSLSLSRLSRPLLAALVLAVAPAACRKPAQPSEAYTQAHQRFTQLYGSQGERAYVDPAMAEVEALLNQVPTDSLDAPSAQELRTRIQTGRAQLEANRKAREDAVAKAREPGSMPPSQYQPPTETPPPAPAVADAGAPSDKPVIGTPASELASGFQGCFQKGAPLEVTGRGMRDRWELSGSARCRQSYGSLQDQVIVVEDGKVLAVVPRSSIEETPASPKDGGR